MPHLSSISLNTSVAGAPRSRVPLGPAFEVTSVDDGSQVRLAVRGELDLATVDQLADALVAAGRRDVTVDLSELEFVSSSGIALLVEDREVRARDGLRLTIIAREGCAAHRLLYLTGLLGLVAA